MADTGSYQSGLPSTSNGMVLMDDCPEHHNIMIGTFADTIPTKESDLEIKKVVVNVAARKETDQRRSRTLRVAQLAEHRHQHEVDIGELEEVITFLAINSHTIKAPTKGVAGKEDQPEPSLNTSRKRMVAIINCAAIITFALMDEINAMTRCQGPRSPTPNLDSFKNGALAEK
jgi:hypothetical protein